MYKVLDVREHIKIGKVQFANGLNHLEVASISQTLHVVVIAEELATGRRVRFDFYPSYSFEFGGTVRYGGYSGPYDVLVPGDLFSVHEEQQPTLVRIIGRI